MMGLSNQKFHLHWQYECNDIHSIRISPLQQLEGWLERGAGVESLVEGKASKPLCLPCLDSCYKYLVHTSIRLSRVASISSVWSVPLGLALTSNSLRLYQRFDGD